jgi:hypothetical protein
VRHVLGSGRIKLNKTLAVKIPAGVDEGDRVRLSGEGEPGVNGGPSGDLYVQVHVKPHPVFQRDHDDLHCEMPVSITIAALGGDVTIPTLDGSAKIRVPAETQTGKTFRLKGKGIKGVRSHEPGELFCHVVVETPVSLTERQRQLLREFESISSQDSARHNRAPRAGSIRSRPSSKAKRYCENPVAKLCNEACRVASAPLECASASHRSTPFSSRCAPKISALERRIAAIANQATTGCSLFSLLGRDFTPGSHATPVPGSILA